MNDQEERVSVIGRNKSTGFEWAVFRSVARSLAEHRVERWNATPDAINVYRIEEAKP